MPTRLTSRLLIGAAVVCAVGASGCGSGDQAMAASFKLVRDAGPVGYATERQRFLEEGAPAMAFLRRRRDSTKDPEERWLCEILLDRQSSPEGFSDLAARFSRGLRFLWNHRPHGPLDGDRAPDDPLYAGYTLLLGGEPLPPPIGGLAPEAQRSWGEATRLPESQLWPSVLGEWILKGPPGSVAPHPAGEAAVPEDSYVAHALAVLKKLGDPRAAPILRRRIEEGDLPEAIADYGVFYLGWFRDRPSTPLLLKIAEDEDASDRRRQLAIHALVDIGAHESVPRLRALRNRIAGKAGLALETTLRRAIERIEQEADDSPPRVGHRSAGAWGN